MPPDDPRRQVLLQAAQRLFEHYGPGKTTIADIAREAHVAVGSVYLEFASKEAIVEALAQERHDAVLRSMRDACGKPKQTAAQRLVAAIDAKVEALLRVASTGQHAAELVHCGRPAVQTAYERFQAEEEALMAALLRQGAEQGEFDVRDPVRTAATLRKAYQSFAPPWLFDAEPVAVREALTAMHDLVLCGVLARSEPPPRRRRG